MTAFADVIMPASEWPAKVRWAGRQHPNCRPGTTGVVVKIAHHDPSSIKVRWDDRPEVLGLYTWEREKNLELLEPGVGTRLAVNKFGDAINQLADN